MVSGVKVNVAGNAKAPMGAIGHNRRALSDINRNIVSRPQPRPSNPLAVNKRGVSVAVSE